MIPVVDLFAGPGGLNEGFGSVGEHGSTPTFRTIASFEMDKYAHQTLLLRAIYRGMKRGAGVAPSYYEFTSGRIDWDQFSADPVVAELLAQAQQEVHQIELGPDNRVEADGLIRSALAESLATPEDDWVLIGGPPCQAYSLAGRSRRTNDKAFVNDKKHFLYREYLHIIEEFAPSIFVMENVKGLLSSTHGGTKMFDLILSDLSNPKEGLEYEIRSLVVPGAPETLEPRDFIIKSEEYGVPQRRHRVILVGVRRDLAARTQTRVLKRKPTVTIRDAIGDLPKIRSAIAPPRDDSTERWTAIHDEMYTFANQVEASPRRAGRPRKLGTGGPSIETYVRIQPVSTYAQWIADAGLRGITLHEARRHMRTDLLRYGFLACRALAQDKSPSLLDLPETLQPAHKNIGKIDTPFTDRFRVQLWDSPSTTIVSHIAKDGHYYIHPDPEQMRSFTVREAARLQSFPDNYFFRGTRTQQYSQVGNAVPPLLAKQIAELVAEMLRYPEPDFPESAVLESMLLSTDEDIEQTSALAF
jgi:DNA (cytosine-5)-methyltransferase 1